MAVPGDFILSIPQELLGNVSLLVTILQAVGGVIIIYIIFNITMTVINRKRNKKIDQIIEDVKRMNQNLEEIKSLLRRK
jgi:hypothetical protein